MDRYFRHETLIAYKLAVSVARWIRYEARFPRTEANLKDQAQRSADSVVLNLAEGCNRTGKDRLYHFRVAQGSAAECGAIFDLLDLPAAPPHKSTLRRIAALIHGLS